MKVLLQHIQTGFFLQPDGEWNAEYTTARAFPNSLSAIHFSQENNFKNVQVVLKFKQSRYDVSLPVSPRKIQ